MNKSIIIIAVVVCFLVLLAAGGYWVQSRASPPSAAILSPRQALLNSGTAIQVPAVDPSTLSGNWSVTPPDCTGTSNVYSFSMDIQLASGWSSVGGSAYYLFKHAGYSPYFSINNGSPTGSWYEHNGVTIDQQTIGNSGYGGNADIQVYNGVLSTSWTNITFVSNGTNITLYVNGVPMTNITSPDLRVNTTGIKWDKGPWTWEGLSGRYSEPRPGAGLVSIKNFYWWSNKALSPTDISTLIGTPAPSPKTSTYVPEPYSK